MRAPARLLVLFLVLLLAPAPAPAADARFDHGLLWRVERPGVPASHVFGTAHIAEPGPLPPPVAEAFAAADSLSIEVLLTPRLQAQMLAAMLPEAGQSLDKVLPPELYGAAMAYAARYLLDPDRIRGLKPWALLGCFALPPSEFIRQQHGELGLDFRLQREAERAGKRVYGLETGAEHIDALAGLPLSAQIDLLRSILSVGDPEQGFAVVRGLYEAGDLGALAAVEDAELARLDPADAAVVRARLIDDRNRRMVERMAPRLAEGRAFIAVGALHLPGPDGILSLLERRGYAVTRVY
ncbi:MAG: TraB/GumN family protein [Rhodospirillaceae bacterium]|nr:TraB/GumN family protein [Rhodospirillaceae bacterium]